MNKHFLMAALGICPVCRDQRSMSGLVDQRYKQYMVSTDPRPSHLLSPAITGEVGASTVTQIPLSYSARICNNIGWMDESGL